jgi:hypothetical protein
MNATSRRALLARAPVAAAAALAGGTVSNAVAIGMTKAAEIDPIFAVIAEHRDAQEALHVACKANGLDMEECPIKTAAENRAGDAELPLFTTAPTTVAGAAALLAYVGSDAHEMNQGPDDNGRPYTVLSYAAGWGADDRIDAVRRFPLHVGVALRNMIGQQTRVVQPAERDPIFAAIERERAAYAEYLATGAIQHQVSDQNPFPAPKRDRRAEKKRLKSPEHKTWWARYQEAEKANTEAAQALWSAREAFLQTKPTTVVGLLAFLDHVEGPLSTGDAGEAFWDEEEHKLAFPTLAAATRNFIARGQA